MTPFRFSSQFQTLQFDFVGSFLTQGVTAVFGPSGAGKTTLLRCFAGLQVSQKGELKMGSEVWQDAHTFVPTHKRRLGYVFQENGLFPHLTVLENLKFGMPRSQPPPSAEIDQLTERLRLSNLLTRSTASLSGGERQRLGLARALLRRPKILLMDEPLSSLDEEGKEELLPYLEQCIKDLQIPVLYVTHSTEEVARLAKAIILVSGCKVQAHGLLSTMLDNDQIRGRLKDRLSRA